MDVDTHQQTKASMEPTPVHCAERWKKLVRPLSSPGHPSASPRRGLLLSPDAFVNHTDAANHGYTPREDRGESGYTPREDRGESGYTPREDRGESAAIATYRCVYDVSMATS
ncbi:hypothetical protein PG997_004024 [Apiospora hydei]|uniref:Uncharacterized protein n=1 Tax=Apiospora hydei TaxID=1337664 RepID=A0ABR1X0W5_9PEZI